MDVERGADAAVANAGNWLRLVFHALACNNTDCMLGDRCSGGKQLLSHVLSCESPGACAVASCSSVRRLTLHWLRCQDENCRLCAGVWRDLSGAYDHSGHHDRGEAPSLGQNSEPSPPEAPGTPDHFGLPAQIVLDNDRTLALANAVSSSGSSGNMAAAPGVPQPMAQDFGEPLADRAVLQLQETTTYMRYLLHGLMCRNGREAPARAPGLRFWLSVLLPAAGLDGGPTGGPADAAVLAGAGAGPVGVEAGGALGLPPSAGRRLLTHRLTCRNHFCALCAGTCDLFTRGNALQQELPVPTALGDMDQIVQELSLALGSVNL